MIEKHENFAALVENFVHNQVWTFDELTRAFDEAGAAHMCKRVQFQSIDAFANA